MCNNLHSDSKPIPKTGYGWKIVNTTNEGNFHSAVFSVKYKSGRDGTIKWDEENGGFCFFLLKGEAIRADKSHHWSHSPALKQEVVKIKYYYGMGKHKERGFIGGRSFEIALCKEFRFVK